MPLLDQLFKALEDAKSRADVAGVVITGRGEYYSAGVDLSSLITPMQPSKLVRKIRAQNQTVFSCFLEFPKPIIAAVNGPAIGAAVTSAILTDAVVAAERATFSLPFAKLGVPPEGCSSVTFPERMGAPAAQRMLGEENWIPTATEALDAHLIDEVVASSSADVGLENAAVVARAVELVEARLAAHSARRHTIDDLLRLRRVNAEESADLANAFVSSKFLGAMEDFNRQRKKAQMATFFWAARTALPLWQPAPIDPNYEYKLWAD